MSAYYNEIDTFAASWLRELIKAGHIADGIVDERSIKEVEPQDLKGFTQCHFFAGIGVWSYALRSAGWTDDTPVWTGSCPCQSFSASGKRGGFSDKRHLWPSWYRLIRECRPDVCFGEQVASQDGLAWLDVVSADMEAEGYAFGAVDICAAGFGAPHIRNRLYFVADGNNERHAPLQRIVPSEVHSYGRGGRTRIRLERRNSVGELADAGCVQHLRRDELRDSINAIEGAGEAGERTRTHGFGPLNESPNGGAVNFWSNAEWIPCRDGKWRPVEPGTFPLAHGATNRLGRLRGYGNAIVAEAAKGFIESYLELT